LLLVCGLCCYADLLTDAAAPVPESCPNCGSARTETPGTEARFRALPAVIPASFRTMLDHDADASEEQERAPGYSVTVAVTAAPENALAPHEPAGLNVNLRLVPEGRVYRINDNAGALFEGRSRPFECYYYRGTRRIRFPLAPQWISREFQPGWDGAGGEKIALVSPKTTDVLQVRPRSNPSGLALDPLREGSAVRAAYYSAGFLLARAAADELDVDPAEFEVSGLFQDRLPGQGTAGQPVGLLLVNDRLPNGAGFTRWLDRNFPGLLRSLLNGSNRFGARLLEEQHRRRCDSKCPVCLQHFRNMNYHGLLDWRLGLAMLRILAEETWVCGLDGDFQGPELGGWPVGNGLLGDWLSWAAALVAAFCQDFQFEQQTFGILPGFLDDLGRAFVAAHPLWPKQSNVEDNVLARARLEAGRGGREVEMVDTFNLAVRPAWVRGRVATGGPP
jgi:hypothetical protein